MPRPASHHDGSPAELLLEERLTAALTLLQHDRRPTSKGRQQLFAIAYDVAGEKDHERDPESSPDGAQIASTLLLSQHRLDWLLRVHASPQGSKKSPRLAALRSAIHRVRGELTRTYARKEDPLRAHWWSKIRLVAARSARLSLIDGFVARRGFEKGHSGTIPDDNEHLPRPAPALPLRGQRNLRSQATPDQYEAWIERLLEQAGGRLYVGDVVHALGRCHGVATTRSQVLLHHIDERSQYLIEEMPYEDVFDGEGES